MSVNGVNALRSRIKNLPQKLKKEIGGNVQDAANLWIGMAKNDAPGDTGTLRSQLSVKKITELSYEVVSGASYAGYIEFGTKGNYRPIPGTEEIASELKSKKSPGTIDDFLLAIVDWVRRKGISGRYSVKSKKRVGNKSDQLVEDFDVAFVIMMSILKKGVKPHPYFFKQRDKVEAELRVNISNTLKSIGD